MKTIKSIIKVTTIIIACIALVFLFCEAETAGMQLLCTGGSLAVLAGCSRILEKMGVFNN